MTLLRCRAFGLLLGCGCMTSAVLADGVGDFNGDGFDDLAIGVPGQTVNAQANAGAVHVLYGSGGGLKAVGTQYFTQDSAGVPDAAEAGDSFGSAFAAGDFNGDGFDDLAIGSPGETLGANAGAGAVHVLFGSENGLTVGDAQFIQLDHPAFADGGGSAASDAFGTALAAGDFDFDGYCDLAVGAPARSTGGEVTVIDGSATGLRLRRHAYWTQDSPGIKGRALAGEQFGAALAVGDFDRDLRADLAIGVPNDQVDGVAAAGAINVLYGSRNGLTDIGDQLWSQNSGSGDVAGGIPDTSEVNDHFGSSLAVADFDGDRLDDLLIGVPDEDLGPLGSQKVNAGAVHLLFGSTRGLTDTGTEFWHQDSKGIKSNIDNNEQFATCLGGGDFDNDGYADLASGVHGETVSAQAGAGAVNVIRGGPNGLRKLRDLLLTQDMTGVRGVAGANDAFGTAVATGDFNNDGFLDLAIGVPGETVNAAAGAGAVNVLYGSPVGLSGTGDQLWHEDRANINDTAEANDGFGSAL